MIKLNEQDELSPTYNFPKTYAIVYKGTTEVVIRMGEEMYFRGKRTAEEFLYKLEMENLDSNYEIIQLRPNKYAEMLSDRLETAKNTNPKHVRQPKTRRSPKRIIKLKEGTYIA